MFKIVEIRVKETEMIGLGERGERLARFTEWGRHDGYFVTAPMLSSSPLYEKITYETRLLLGSADKLGRWFAVDLSSRYVLVETTAPVDYDYGYVVPVCDLAETACDKPGRLLAIPHKSVEYQTGRYSSGLHGSRILDPASGVFSEIETC